MGKPSQSQRLLRTRLSGRKARIAYDADQHAFTGGCHTCGRPATQGIRTDVPEGYVILRACDTHAQPDHQPLASLWRPGDHPAAEPKETP